MPQGKSMETETITWSEFLYREKVTVEHMPGLKEIIKPKRAGQWESELGIQVGKLNVRLFDIEKW